MFAARWLPLGAVTLMLLGCAVHEPAAVKLGLSHPVWTDDGLYLVEQDGPGALFLAPPGRGIEDYSQVILEDVRLSYQQGVRNFGPQEETRLTAIVSRNVLRFLASHGWEQTDRPSPNALRARLAITDIDVKPSVIWGAGSAIFRPSGGASITLELRDSVDDRRVFLYAQRRQLPYGSYGGPGHIEAERVADAVYEYAKDLVRYVDEAGEGKFVAPRKRAARSR